MTIVDRAVKELFAKYDDDIHDIRGYVEVNVSQGEDFRHLGLWAMHSGSKERYYNTTRTIHANGAHACTISATVELVDLKNPKNADIAKEFNTKLRRAIEDSPVVVFDVEPT
jgi:hypothetical protein